MIHDEEFTELLEKAHVEKRVLSWVDGETEADTLDSLIEAEPDDGPLPRPGRPQPDHHPHLRHHRYAEGRAAQRGRHRRRDLAALADAAEVRLAGAHRGAAVPHLGLRAPDAVAAARPHDRAAAQVRPGGRARPGRRPAVRRDGRDPGDAAAHPRAARRDARATTASRPSRWSPRRGRRCPATSRSAGWTASATTSTTPTARPRSPTRRSPPPRTCARSRPRPASRRGRPS